MSRTALLVGAIVVVCSGLTVGLAQPASRAIEEEALSHFQSILRLDTSNPPGNERLVVDYVDKVMRQAGIETQRFARDPNRPNLVARLRGNGTKRPLLVMGHTDVVTVDAAKWTHPPFSATRDGGYATAAARSTTSQVSRQR